MLQDTGPVNRVPPYDARTGEHLWVVLAAYRINPAGAHPGGTIHLDLENLIHLGSTGCFHCEQGFTPPLLHRRCPGPPKSRR